MSDFFHGWRWKAGCVLLVMACVFVGGWVRSQELDDSFELLGEIHITIMFESRNGRIELYSVATEALNPVIHGGRDFRIDDWTLSYWSIVIPLTALSAYLILWPERRKGAALPTGDAKRLVRTRIHIDKMVTSGHHSANTTDWSVKNCP